MNIVQTLRNLFNYWNLTNHCGECWEFEAPMTEKNLNTSLPKSEEGECCYRVFLTDYGVRENRTYNTSGLVADRYNEHTFQLLVLKKSDPGRNMDLEQKHEAPETDTIQYTSEESKWELYHHPILECFSEALLPELCVLLGRGLRNPTRSWSIVIDYADQNYDGWRIRFSLQDYRPDLSTLYEYIAFSLAHEEQPDVLLPGGLTVTLTGTDSGKEHVLNWDGAIEPFLNTGLDTEFEISVLDPEEPDTNYIMASETISLVSDGELETLTGLVRTITDQTFYNICWSGAGAGDEQFQFETLLDTMTEWRARSLVCTDEADPLGTEILTIDQDTNLPNGGVNTANLEMGSPLLSLGQFHGIVFFERFDPSNFTYVPIADLEVCD